MRHFRTFLASVLLPASALAQGTDAGPTQVSDASAGASEGSPGAPTSSEADLEEDSIPLKQPTTPPPSKRTHPSERAPSEGTAPAERSAPTERKTPSKKTRANARDEDADDEDARDEDAERDDADDDDAEQAESRQFGYFALGPAMLSITGYEEYGFAMAGGGRFPLHDRIALNAGVTWGLTSFDRTGEWWEEARKVGSWTTRAYGNVTEWAREGDEDDEAFRFIAAFYAYIGLLFPYAVSGIMYVLGPFAATSYLDFHMEATFHLFETRKGPYAGAGLGTAAIIFPIEREMKGAVGPSINLGFDFGWFGIEARGFYSPPYLHGEPSLYRTDIFTGQFLFRFQGK
jgi:hypothetical protein